MTRRTIYDPVNNDQWMVRANCLGIDADLFFPDRGTSTTEAKAICAACTVREQCLEYSLTHQINAGIWGGKSERERRRIRTARRRAAAARLAEQPGDAA